MLAMRCGGVVGLRLSLVLLPHLMNGNRHGRERHREIGEQHGDELIAAPTHAARPQAHRLADDETHSQGDPTDNEAGDQREDDVKSESDQRARDAEYEGTHERGMGVLRCLLLDLIRTFRADLSGVDLKIRPSDGALAGGAGHRRAVGHKFGGGELRHSFARVFHQTTIAQFVRRANSRRPASTSVVFLCNAGDQRVREVTARWIGVRYPRQHLRNGEIGYALGNPAAGGTRLVRPSYLRPWPVVAMRWLHLSSWFLRDHLSVFPVVQRRAV